MRRGRGGFSPEERRAAAGGGRLPGARPQRGVSVLTIARDPGGVTPKLGGRTLTLGACLPCRMGSWWPGDWGISRAAAPTRQMRHMTLTLISLGCCPPALPRIRTPRDSGHLLFSFGASRPSGPVGEPVWRPPPPAPRKPIEDTWGHRWALGHRGFASWWLG
jgi:hypothetical protein